MSIQRNKKMRIIYVVLFIILVIISVICFFIFIYYSEKNITKTINNYLTDRYNEISIDNIDKSFTYQTNYYSKKFIANPTSVNSKDSIEAGKKYFQDMKFSTIILESSTEKLTHNTYEARVTVLYANESIEYDNLVNYVFMFKITKQGFSKYVFDNIEIISNSITYINGGEIHIHDGKVVICHDKNHDNCENH